MEDIRWKQRFSNLKRAIIFFEEVVEQEEYSKLEAAGLTQSFEFTFELTWKTLKDYLNESGFVIRSPREAIKQGFQSEIIQDGHLWMKMLEERNRLTHTYNEAQAKAAIKLIKEVYFPAIYQVFKELEKFE